MPPTILTLSKTDDSVFQKMTNYKKSVDFLYEVGSLYKTKGSHPNIIQYYILSFCDTMKHTIYHAIHYQSPKLPTFIVRRSFITEYQKQFTKPSAYQRSLSAYHGSLSAYQRSPSAYQRSLSAYQRSASPYNTTLFSWPTRNRVFNMMSNPASSMFLQNATSSLHMSTSSNPSFPRIRWSSLLKNG